MRRLILIFFIFPLFASSKIELKDVYPMMEKLLDYHVEQKELTLTLVKRMVKIYIEQFDQERSYLLEKEAAPYLSLSTMEAKALQKSIQKGDFSYFDALDEFFSTAIDRARKERLLLSFEEDSSEVKEEFAKTEKELFLRNQRLFSLFLEQQKKISAIDTEHKRKKALQLFEKKQRRMEEFFLAKEKRALRVMKAFAKSLDAHSAFFSDEEAFEMRLSLEKEFKGIGVILTENVEGVFIASLVENGPAKKSKQILENDLLVEINGESLESLSFDDILFRLKENAEVTLGLKHKEKENFSPLFYVTLKREVLSMDEGRLTISSEPFGDGIIGILFLNSFYENESGVSSEKDIREAIHSFQKQGKLKGLILDLRDNPGGFLTQAVKVSGLFAGSGIVVISKYSKGEMHYMRNSAMEKAFEGPLIILTSKLSASASEIVAQALQDYGVALIVGDERTFGKGSIQYQTVTSDKADAFYKVTVGKYYTISGKTTQIDGVIADIVVPGEYANMNFGERFLEYPLSSDRITALDTYAERALFSDLSWKAYLPQLKENSKQRLLKQKAGSQVQMHEALNILKDLILLQARP